MASIEIKGVDKLVSKLNRAASIDVLRPPMKKSIKTIHSATQKYPPKRAGQTYQRTYKLRNDWRIQVSVTGGGLVGHVFNNDTPYGPYVVDERKQAWMHRSRWWTTESLADQHRAEVAAIFKRAIDEALK